MFAWPWMAERDRPGLIADNPQSPAGFAESQLGYGRQNDRIPMILDIRVRSI